MKDLSSTYGFPRLKEMQNDFGYISVCFVLLFWLISYEIACQLFVKKRRKCYFFWNYLVFWSCLEVCSRYKQKKFVIKRCIKEFSSLTRCYSYEGDNYTLEVCISLLMTATLHFFELLLKKGFNYRESRYNFIVVASLIQLTMDRYKVVVQGKSVKCYQGYITESSLRTKIDKGVIRCNGFKLIWSSEG